jgi:hypothetical protein
MTGEKMLKFPDSVVIFRYEILSGKNVQDLKNGYG